MIRRFLVIIALVIVGSFISLPAATAKETPKFEFMLISHTTVSPFWTPVRKGMRDAAEMLGVNAQFIGPTTFSPSMQVDMFESGIAKRVDGIGTTMTDPTAFEAPTKKALKKGIPVIAFNTDDSDSERLAYIGEPWHVAGHLQGKIIAEHVPGEVEAVVTVCEPGHAQLEDRAKSCREILEEHNMKVYRLNTSTQAAEAIGKFKGFFRSHPNIKVVASTAEDVRFAAQALKELGYKPDEVYVAGYNLVPVQLELLREGYIDLLMDQQPYLQGFYTVVQLYLCKKYGFHPSNVNTASGYVTRENSDIEKLLEFAEAGYR